MEAIQATLEDRTMRYCTPYAAARKTGRPKIDKRLKSPLEGKSKRKRGDVNKGKQGRKEEESRFMKVCFGEVFEWSVIILVILDK